MIKQETLKKEILDTLQIIYLVIFLNNDKSNLMAEIERINDENELFEIFEDSDDFEIRYTIVNRIEDDSILYNIFSNEEDSLIKRAALDRISMDFMEYGDFDSLDGIEKISYIKAHNDESLLCRVAEYDKNFHVRIAAILKISDMDFLLRMADSHDDYDTRVVLYKKLNGQSLLEEISGENLAESRMNLVNDLDNEKFIEDIAVNDSDLEVMLSAFKKLNKPNFFFNVLKDTLSDIGIRRFVMAIVENRFSDDILDYGDLKYSNQYEKIAHIETHNDEALFCEIVEKDESFCVRVAAIHKISDMDLLLKIAKSHNDYNTRVVVYKKLNGKSIFDEITDENLTQSHMNLVNDLDNEKFLKDIAVNDSDFDVRKAALERICDEDVLADVVRESSDFEIRYSAMKKLNVPHFYLSVLMDLKNDDFNHDELMQLIDDIDVESLIEFVTFFNSEPHLVGLVINNIADNSILLELYRRGPDSIRQTVLKKLLWGDVFPIDKITERTSIPHTFISVCSEDALADIARNDSDWRFRYHAVLRIDDEDVLADVLRNDSERDVRRAAVKRIHDDDFLVYVARNDSDGKVQSVAVERIDDEML